MRLSISNNRILSILVIICVSICMVVTSFVYTQTADASSTAIVSSSSGVNVRTGPGTSYGLLTSLDYKTEVTIVQSMGVQSDGYNWYQIITPKGSTGYIRADLLTINKNNEYTYDQAFEDKLNAQGFPESYKPYLRDLHANYPEWEFVAQNTGLFWDDVIDKETKIGTSLVSSSSLKSWKNTKSPAYDSETGKFKSYDSGGWNAASTAIVKYYMDPRNFLNASGIFQFLSLYYDPLTQTITGLSKVVQNTFMADTNVYDSTYFGEEYTTYVDLLMDAGMIANVNPYVLASMIIVEQGTLGKGGSITGDQSGFEDLYNFFNIRAYKSGSYSAVQYGLLYAGTEDANTLRPWNTRAASIKGGALIYAKNYVLNNKYTLYLKKWNVLNGLDNVGKGQYMTNIQGAESEASQLRKAYSNMIDDAYTFSIPVYLGMPESTCLKPTSNELVFEEESEQLSEEERARLEEEERLKKEEAERLAKEEAERIYQEKVETFNRIYEGVSNTTFKLSTVKTTKGIQVNWKKSAGFKVDKLELYRSKYKDFHNVTKPYRTITNGTNKTFLNVKKNLSLNTKYYYKIRGVRTITDADGNEVTVYTNFSNIGCRIWK